MILEHVGLSQINGSLVVLDGVKDATFDEMVVLKLNDGTQRVGRIVMIEGEKCVIQVFEGTTGFSLNNTRTSLTGHPMMVDLSPEILGRTLDGLGRPIDGLGEIYPQYRRDVNGSPINPVSRVYPRNYIRTGISAIDALATLIRGQKLPIFSGSGMKHNELAVQIVKQADVSDGEEFAIVFAAMGVSEVTLTAVKQGEATILKVEGSDVGVLIGHRGETMESLSYLAGLVANRLPGDYLKLGLDVGGYRSKREKDLESLARRIGAKVAKTGRSHAMDPMNPYERRIIHSTIGAMQGVRSESKGEGADRRVVIYSTDPNASNLPERREGGRGRNDRGGRPGQGGYRGGPRRDGGHGRSDRNDRNDRGGKGGYRGGERRSSVPEREFADTPRPEGAEPMAPTRTHLIDDAEGLALYGKVEL